MKSRLRVLSDVLFSLAICAWVGGRSALGAFTARILFGKLPRALAAPTMNQIFREYDWVVRAALAMMVVGLVVRVVGRSGGELAERVVIACAGLLIALGLFDQIYLAPKMAALYDAGLSGEGEFAALHRMASATAKIELVDSIALLIGIATVRRPAS